LIDALYQTELNEINRIGEIKALTAGLEQQTLELTDIITRIFDKHPTTRLLLVIDQFEELYTLSPTTTQLLFLNHLLSFLEQHTTPPKTTVLITLRADFLGHALSHPKLAKLLDTYRNKMLGDLSDADLSLAIEQPARALNVTFEEGLAERIVRDVGMQAGSLPLLQFALQQLWERRDQNRLTHAGYEALGTVTQALAHHADQVYERFSETGKTLFRQLFVQMVRPGEGTEDTRQVMVLPADPARHEIIRQLANERLVVTRHDEETEENTVEIAHEALIRHWQRLKAWMKEDRSFRVWQENLRGYMRDQVWLRDARLAVAQDWLAKRDDELTETERDFIQESVAQRDAELAEKRKNQRRWTMFVTVFFVVALVLSGLAAFMWQQSEAKFTQFKISQSRMLAGFAEIALNKGHSATAMRLALEGLPNLSEAYPNRPFVPEVYDSLSKGINQQYSGVFQHSDPVRDAIFSPNGQVIFTRAGRNGYFWDVKTRQQIARLDVNNHMGQILWAHFSPDGKRIVTATSDSNAYVWDTHTGLQLMVLKHKISDDGYTQHISLAEFSPDGKRIITSANHENSSYIWNADTGEKIFSLEGGMIARFSSSGTRVITGGKNSIAHVWDASTGEKLFTLTGHKNRISSARFSPNDEQIVTISDDNTVRLWNAATSELISVLEGHTEFINSVYFSPDGSRVVTAGDKTARIWDTKTGKLLLILNGHTDTINSAHFSMDGKRIVTASSDKTIRVWNIDTGETVWFTQPHNDVVNSARFSPDGKYIVSASRDATASIWNSETGQSLSVLQRHENIILSIVFSPDGTRFAITSQDETVRLWGTETGQLLTTLQKQGRKGGIASATFSQDGKRIVITPNNDTVSQVFDVETSRTVAILKGHRGRIFDATFSPNGKLIVTTSEDKTARLWNAETGQPQLILQGHNGYVYSATFSSDGTRIITTSNDKTARVWDTRTGLTVLTLQGHKEGVVAAIYNPDGKQIITTSFDLTTHVWNANTGQVLAILKGTLFTTYSYSGTRIAIINDKTVEVWDTKTMQLLTTLSGHKDSISSIAFSPNSKYIATASYDRTTRLWDVETGQTLVTLTDRAWVTDVAFSPDGKHIVTASGDNTVRIWLTLPTLKEMIDYAKKMFPPRIYKDKRDAGIENFRLTCAERKQFFLEEIERCRLTKE